MMKKLSFMLLGVVALLLGAAWFLPSEYTVMRQVRIMAPRETVFLKVADYASWKEWSPWYEREPAAQVDFIGVPGLPGYTMTWNGKEIGEGALLLQELDAPSRMVSTLSFVKPKMAPATDQWAFVAINESETSVTWTNQGTLSWPANRFIGLFLNRMLGTEMERGLSKLKQISEGTHP
jgi:hypothetical protein